MVALVVRPRLPKQALQEVNIWSLGQEDPLKEGLAIHSVYLPGESRAQRSLVSYSPQWGKESDTTEVT